MTTSTPSPGRYWLDVALNTQDPHSMTGAAVTGLLAVLVDHEETEARSEASTAAYDELDAEYRELEAEAGRRAQVIDDIIAAVKPSTSKLADKVRSIVEESIVAHAGTPVIDPTPGPDPVVEVEQPAADASLEKWRDYARSKGFQDVDQANRSMIRTMLGLPVAGPLPTS